ncbi:hypothetical protein APR50_05810 [Variovorax paradoxus]|nr:hypothetical protein APR52_08470 [Variovorax paradoxus]KPV10589.1 hypothetical protein APR50_05810 [Variovorax paradoxus]KPV12982.1 hypothetical protein APR49_05170 [Variovorax paradoxus]KPV25073.1 hypothetical protein APR51_02000 [Variovorax paradoxus]KPV36210.1 hypothetical protein APR48_01255 [Variovorax paradoxus]
MVQFGPGGTTDLVGRALSAELSKSLGQPIVVLNRPGGQGTVMGSLLARAQPDGYQIGMLSSGLALWQLVTDKPYTVKDFSSIASVGRYVFAVVVNADSPYKTIEDLIAASHKAKGGINFGGPSSVNTLGMLLLAEKTGMQFETVNYRSGSDSVVALLGNQIDVVVQNPTDFMPYVKAGKLRVLAACSETRLRDLPDVPTLRELGYDVVTDAYFGVGAPAGLPEPLRAKLEAATLRVARDPAFQKQLIQTYGIEPAPLSGAEYRAVIEKAQITVAKLKSRFPSSSPK